MSMQIRESEDGKVVQKKKIIIEDSGAEKKEAAKIAVGAEDDKTGNAAIDDIKMLVSGILHKDGKTFARVSFLRGEGWAEGIVPDGVIEKSEGFTEEEIGQLNEYLTQQKEMILKQAKGVNPIKNLFF